MLLRLESDACGYVNCAAISHASVNFLNIIRLLFLFFLFLLLIRLKLTFNGVLCSGRCFCNTVHFNARLCYFFCFTAQQLTRGD